jgi:hypothetical protein
MRDLEVDTMLNSLKVVIQYCNTMKRDKEDTCLFIQFTTVE